MIGPLAVVVVDASCALTDKTPVAITKSTTNNFFIVKWFSLKIWFNGRKVDDFIDKMQYEG
jgi:hypothetical protein